MIVSQNDINIKNFFALLQAGLWEKETKLYKSEANDLFEILKVAEDQSVVGLVAAGIEHLYDEKVPKEIVLQFVGEALKLEERNKAMDSFIASLIDNLRRNGVYTLLLKGQGIAQCYERPLWRSSGDIDLFLSENNYKSALEYLKPYAKCIDEENVYSRHIGMNIGQWEVELHGFLRCGLWKKIDAVLDDIQSDIFFGGKVRSWMNNNCQVFLPKVDEDVVYVFAHILQHYFKGGVGLRQICDWCRLIWTFKDSIDVKLLERRVRGMSAMSEWKTFAAFAIDYLGFPIEAMPLYSDRKCWHKKAKHVLPFVLETGNFGHKRDNSYLHNKPSFKRKVYSLRRATSDCIHHFFVFPFDSLRVWFGIVKKGISSFGEGTFRLSNR